jgi:hypothetical protein
MPYTDDLPAAPPPELLAEIDAAFQRACAPLEDRFALHFEPERGARRVRC